MSYIIEHEGPRVFVVYKIDGDNKTEVERFKTNHTAMKKYGNNIVLNQGSNTKSKFKKEPSVDQTKNIAEHLGSSTNSVYKKAMKSKSRKLSIRAFCKMCVGGNSNDVKECPSVECPLHKFRITG